MANQLNFSEELTGFSQRPSRLTKSDLDLAQAGTKQIVFGTTNRDVVELWMYNPDGSIAGHLNISPMDTAVSLTTLVDNTGPVESLNVDLVAVAQKLALDPGRYSMVMNFFRDEVGSETTYKFYISDISPDRLHVQLTPVMISEAVQKDIYEFIEPSVPRVFSKALLDEIFGKAITSVPSNQLLFSLDSLLETLSGGIHEKLRYANIDTLLEKTIKILLDRTYIVALNNLIADAKNLNVQRVELEEYVFQALSSVLYSMISTGEIDSRFKVS
jgi:hypothetical protein